MRVHHALVGIWRRNIDDRPLDLSTAEARVHAILNLHRPSTTGAYRPNPYTAPADKGGRQVCIGCGGVNWWPCTTFQLATGVQNREPLPPTNDEIFGTVPVG